MPGKSRHGKGKHQSYSKKSKAKQRYMAMGSPQGGITGTPQPTGTVRTPAPASAPTPVSKVKAIQYPYITSEL